MKIQSIPPKASLAAALLLVSSFCLGNPVPDPAYDLAGEKVTVKATPFRSQVTGRFDFIKTGFLLGDEERGTSKMVAASDAKIKEIGTSPISDARVDVYFPVFAAASWNKGANFHKEVAMQAFLVDKRARSKLPAAFASKKEIKESIKKNVQKIPGTEIVWFKVSLPKGAAPEKFSIELSYTQPSVPFNKAIAFPYIPLLPAGKNAANGNYRFEMIPPKGKKLSVLSKHRFRPMQKKEELVFWPVDEEIILVAVVDKDE